MNSRTLVRKTLEFEHAGRVPRHLWTLPWASDHYPEELAALRRDYPDDIESAPAFLTRPLPTEGHPHEPGTFVDEWGCVFENMQRGIVGEVKAPIVQDWNDTGAVHIPVERLSIDPEKINAFCRESDRFVMSGTCARPFEQLQFLRGTENLFMDLALQDNALFAFLHRMHQFYLDEMTRWAETDVDALNFMDDWGTQQSLLISPDMWRAVFKPLYKDYVEVAHAHGKKIFMHSDGNIRQIYPDLVELGVDAVNSQIFCMGLDELSRFAGNITFWGEMDRQHLLVDAGPAEVAAAVRDIHANLYRNGGVIAQCEFGPGAKPENVRAVFATWDKLG